jgi:hypothetical protein
MKEGSGKMSTTRMEVLRTSEKQIENSKRQGQEVIS